MQKNFWTEETISTLLRKHGLRVTAPRIAICKQLLAQHCHYSAQQLHEELAPLHPTMSPNTVYLTLNQLAAIGLIRSFNIDGNTIFDSNTATHDHAHCRNCNTLVDLPSNSEMPPVNMGEWALEWGTRLWSGLCPDCKQSANTTSAS